MLISALLLAGMAAQANAAELMVKDAWVRLTPPVAENTAAYMSISNHGNKAVTIIKVTTDTARMADLHGMRMNEERMQMYPLGKVTIKAGTTMDFEPGGKHVMLMGLTRPLQKNETITLTLHFADGSSQVVRLPVRDMRLGGMMHDQGHGSMGGHHGGM
jgi:hypothetical protein